MFRDRVDAGQRLADKLQTFELINPLVLAIPRGGIVPAAVIADAVGAELDVVLTHKLRAPFQHELAIGAIAEDGSIYLMEHANPAHGVSEAYLQTERNHQANEIRRRQQLFRNRNSIALIKDRTVILTDDGVATGATMFAAIALIQSQQPHELIVAIPVAPPDTLQKIRARCNRVVCLESPERFMAVGQFYEEFLAVSDDEVVAILKGHP